MLTHRQKCLLCIGISRARAFCLPRFIFPGPGICVYFYERHQCVWKQTNHGIEERRKWGVRDCSFIVNHQRNKMAIPRKPAVCVCVVDRLLLVRKAREDSRLAYPQISCFFWPGSNIHFFFFFFLFFFRFVIWAVWLLCVPHFYVVLREAKGERSVLFFIAIFFTTVLRIYLLRHKVVRWLPIPWFRFVWFSIQFITVPIYSWDCWCYRRLLLGGYYGTCSLSLSLSFSCFVIRYTF